MDQLPNQPSLSGDDADHEDAPVVCAQLALLEYLIGVAQDTSGADVWRALFSEMHHSIESTDLPWRAS